MDKNKKIKIKKLCMVIDITKRDDIHIVVVVVVIP